MRPYVIVAVGLVSSLGFGFASAGCSGGDAEGDATSSDEISAKRHHHDAGATIDSGATTDAGGGGATTDSGAATSDSGAGSGSDAGSGSGTGTVCTTPVFVTSDPNGGWSTEGYYVHNNMWNSAAGPETLYACSYHSWYVVSTQTNDAGAVKTYPNVHKDYANVAIGSFTTITSSFAATSPHVGIYDVAYDIWTNGVATNGSTEIMIWTENFNQVPAGSKVTQITLGGQAYDVWKTSDDSYIAFVPTQVMTSGTLDLLGMFEWLMSKGWLPSNSTLGQIDYGVEVVSTNGAPATFQFTNFSITDQ